MSLRTITFTAAALLTVAACTHAATPARAAEPYGCVVYEDASYRCGTLEAVDPINTNATSPWTVDLTRPSVAGCIPGGPCDEST